MAKEVEEKRARREEQAYLWPVAGTVHSCVVIDQDGKDVLSAAGGFNAIEGETGYRAMFHLAQFITPDEQGVVLFGLNVRDRMRVMALDALRYCQLNPTAEKIPPHLWCHKAFESGPWADPYELLVPSERRSDIPWDGLCDFLGIELPPAGVNLDTDPKAAAEIARQLTLRGNLLAF